MPRNYQSKKNNPYLLPHNLYMRVLYIIKDYDRLKDEYHALDGYSSIVLTGLPSGKRLSAPTEDNGLRRAMLFDELEAVEQALRTVPECYRLGVIQNVLYGAWFPRDAAVRTYQRWKQRFIFQVAANLKLV